MVSWVSTPFATWSTLIALLSVHLATNYAAVKAVSMRCLNRQRANLVFSSIFEHEEVLSPSDVSKRERVFERDGVLRWANDEIVGYCRIGVSLHTLLSLFGRRHRLTGSLDLQGIKMSELLDIFADEAYILWPASPDYEALIVLKDGCAPIDQLKAWAHALLLARKRRRGRGSGGKQDDSDVSVVTARLAELRLTLKDTQDLLIKYAEALRDKGWDLNVAVLETRAGTRAEVGYCGKS